MMQFAVIYALGELSPAVNAAATNAANAARPIRTRPSPAEPNAVFESRNSTT